MKVGPCGISCETCGLYTEGLCEGCELSKERVKMLKEIGKNCPMLECAVERDIEVCSRDCGEFPCEKFEGWPLSQSWLEMYKSRSEKEK